MSGAGMDPAMTDDVYLELISRSVCEKERGETERDRESVCVCVVVVVCLFLFCLLKRK